MSEKIHELQRRLLLACVVALEHARAAIAKAKGEASNSEKSDKSD